MEEALNIEYKPQKINGKYYYVNRSKYLVVRYTDDFVVLCKTLKDAKEVPHLLKEYLKERDLTLAPDKTRITHIKDGFDFLGFNIRCYKRQDKNRVLVKASKDSINSFKKKIKDIIRKSYPWNLKESITKLNYLINGTGNYWRMGSNKKLFSKMDNYIYELWMRQIKRWYNNKSVSWMVDKHFKMSLHPNYNDKWTFTDHKTNCQVNKMYWIRIDYPNCIKYKATPFDSNFDEYYEKINSKSPFQSPYG